MDVFTENLHKHEVENFTELANYWWDLDGPCKILHTVNPVRLSFIANQIKLQNSNILDVGCGGGILSESLARKGALVTGIDASASLINVANTHAATQGLDINYQCLTAERLLAVKTGEQFDNITCLELVEHVPNLDLLIRSLAALLKPGGQLFISTLNRNFFSYLMAIIAAEKIFRLLPAGTHSYKNFIKPSELQKCLQQYGLNINKISGIMYVPWLNVAYLSKDVKINYIISAVKAV